MTAAGWTEADAGIEDDFRFVDHFFFQRAVTQSISRKVEPNQISAFGDHHFDFRQMSFQKITHEDHIFFEIDQQISESFVPELVSRLGPGIAESVDFVLFVHQHNVFDRLAHRLISYKNHRVFDAGEIESFSGRG